MAIQRLPAMEAGQDLFHNGNQRILNLGHGQQLINANVTHIIIQNPNVIPLQEGSRDTII